MTSSLSDDDDDDDDGDEHDDDSLCSCVHRFVSVDVTLPDLPFRTTVGDVTDGGTTTTTEDCVELCDCSVSFSIRSIVRHGMSKSNES
jgi:hypothetical protein